MKEIKTTTKKVAKPRIHRHKWMLAQEGCLVCGHYTEMCMDDDCMQERLVSASGKVIDPNVR